MVCVLRRCDISRFTTTGLRALRMHRDSSASRLEVGHVLCEVRELLFVERVEAQQLLDRGHNLAKVAKRRGFNAPRHHTQSGPPRARKRHSDSGLRGRARASLAVALMMSSFGSYTSSRRCVTVTASGLTRACEHEKGEAGESERLVTATHSVPG